jgi:hypothetical protein
METNRSGAAVGWITFAGVMMIMAGAFQAFIGLVAIVDDEFYVVTPNYVAQLDATQWGWIHLIVGLIVLAAGFGVFSGNVLARTVGVIVALGSMLTMFFWLPWYPVWAIIILIIDISVIWALTVHGRDMADSL